MKSTAINTLKYTGVVTLSQYIGSKKIKIAQRHNAGGNALFDFLADCLIGDFTKAKATMPNQVMLLSYTENDEGEITDYTKQSDFIHRLTMPEKIYDTTQCKVRYSFIISTDVLESLNFEKLGIGLYTNLATDEDIKNFAAFCKLDGLHKSTFINASLVIDWELIISNTTVS